MHGHRNTRSRMDPEILRLEDWASVGQRKRGNYWEGYSPKMRRSVQTYSSLEYAHWILVEADPRIVSFCEQPMAMRGFVDGRMRRSVPDMWLRYADGGEEIREIKPTALLKDSGSRTACQLAVQRFWCEWEGIPHRIFTDEDLSGKAIFIGNWKAVLRHFGPDYCVNSELRRHLADSFSPNSPVPLSRLDSVRTTEWGVEQLRREVFDMLRTDEWRADLDQKSLSGNTLVWRN